ncbi:MAG: N-acetylmuramic acid 6-phosphate etherase [Caldisericum exile]|uniref:N-acetylmuramic acid 6-phosphate etherase n=2 Tax=Caldisericaceae TaxID=693073 RepID=A0A2J6WER8_9BACT|nr:MAG: N-acetylmuramic acid 6-phosphate etherase [Caldisericum exile]
MLLKGKHQTKLLQYLWRRRGLKMFENDLDLKEIKQLSKMFLEDHKKVFDAIDGALEKINEVIEEVVKVIENGGRIFYIGAGTSGRIAVLDASEIGPTFSRKDLFIPIMAGGLKAVFTPKENLEDDENLGVEELKKRKFKANDFLIGITASGKTPFVIGALKYANSIGSKTAIVANSKVQYDFVSHHVILETGEEFIIGSTRLKAGTSQKIVLNMISTISMMKLGYTYGNLMVSVNPTNKKLIERASNIVSTVSGVEYSKVLELVKQVKDPRVALIMLKHGVSEKEAKEMLKKNNFSFRKAYG